MAFYPLEEATQSPESYRNSLYTALHGPGNSSLPAGYYSLGHAEDFLWHSGLPLLAPNLADFYIPTSNRVKACLSGHVGTVMDVHVPAAT